MRERKPEKTTNEEKEGKPLTREHGYVGSTIELKMSRLAVLKEPRGGGQRQGEGGRLPRQERGLAP